MSTRVTASVVCCILTQILCAVSYTHLRAHETGSLIRTYVSRGVDPYGTGGTCPPIFMKGASMVMSPPNILEVMSFRMSTRVTATVVCSILMQILCVVSQKSLSPRPPV